MVTEVQKLVHRCVHSRAHHFEYEKIDPATPAGFAEIAELFGEEEARAMRRKALVRRVQDGATPRARFLARIALLMEKE